MSSQARRFGLTIMYPKKAVKDAPVAPIMEQVIPPRIVAIHGLDTSSHRTWSAFNKERDPKSRLVNWLEDEDMLPHFFPDARIFAYDWNANTFSDASSQYFHNHAEELLIQLDKHRRKRRDHPIIFVASCYGGLIVAKALLLASTGHSAYSHILSATSGIIFLGTPFRGSDGTSAAQTRVQVGKMTGHDASDALLSVLEKQSGSLDEIRHEFSKLLRTPRYPELHIVCFYETQKTSIYRSVFPNAMSKMFSEIILVDRNSACLDGWDRIPLHVNHPMLNKFRGPSDQNYINVADEIYKVAEVVRQADRIKSFVSGLEDVPTRAPNTEVVEIESEQAAQIRSSSISFSQIANKDDMCQENHHEDNSNDSGAEPKESAPGSVLTITHVKEGSKPQRRKGNKQKEGVNIAPINWMESRNELDQHKENTPMTTPSSGTVYPEPYETSARSSSPDLIPVRINSTADCTIQSADPNQNDHTALSVTERTFANLASGFVGGALSCAIISSKLGAGGDVPRQPTQTGADHTSPRLNLDSQQKSTEKPITMAPKSERCDAKPFPRVPRQDPARLLDSIAIRVSTDDDYDISDHRFHIIAEEEQEFWQPGRVFAMHAKPHRTRTRVHISVVETGSFAGWWSCSVCKRSNSPEQFSCICTDCGHEKCEDCATISLSIVEHAASHRFPHSFLGREDLDEYLAEELVRLEDGTEKKTGLRQFLVIANSISCVYCCRIGTYGKVDIANLAPSVLRDARAMIYTGSKAPRRQQYTLDTNGETIPEKLVIPPICVEKAEGSQSSPIEYFHPATRVNFGKLYKINKNIRIHNIGLVKKSSKRFLLDYAEKVGVIALREEEERRRGFYRPPLSRGGQKRVPGRVTS